MIVHQEDKTPFECSYCYKKFSYKYHLKTHINNIHILNPFKFKCEICGEFFHKKIKLLKHQRREHKEKVEKIKCYYPYCYKSYLTQSKLDEHIKKIHHNLNVDDINHEIEEKNKKEKYFYKCPFDDCKKIYSTHFNLSTHIKTFHLRIKNFQCDICNKKFFHNSSLKRHILDFHNKNNQQENQIINVENNIQNNIHIDNSFNDILFDLSDNSNILFNSNQYI
jgi:KRAB domain-containing zinc finger protein